MYAAFIVIKAGETGNKHEEAEKDYVAGMKYADIAAKYEVSIDTVKSWKKRYKWVRKSTHTKCTQKEQKSVQTKSQEKASTKETENTDIELTEKQQLFCVYFVKSFNATKAYQKAYGADYKTAAVNGCRLLKNANIRKEIEELKQVTLSQRFIDKEDIVQKYLDIAFADMTDFATFKGKTVLLKNSNEVDGTLISEIKSGKHGPSIKLNDRMKAMEWLSKYFMMNPMDIHKKEYDRKRMELELRRMEYEQKPEEQDTEQNEDNLAEKISETMQGVWDDG